jgi:anti-anti-sigma regulatory factor
MMATEPETGWRILEEQVGDYRLKIAEGSESHMYEDVRSVLGNLDPDSHYLVNLNGVRIIDSKGLGVLKRANEQHIEHREEALPLAHLSDPVYELFQRLRWDRQFRIFSSVESFKRALSRKKRDK